MKSRFTKIAVWTTAIIVVMTAASAAMNHGPDSLAGKLLARITGESHDQKQQATVPHTPRVEVVADRPNTIRFSDEAYTTLAIRTVEVEPAPPPDPLRLPGSLVLDPNRLVRVHSRFTGELAKIGTIGENGSERTLRYGDKVKRGDIMAIVWSKEIGEKKSELVDAISKLDADKKLLERLEATQPGVVAEKMKIDARRTVQADQIALARAQRTLISWRLTDEEIAAIQREADEVRKGQENTDNDKTWAELEIRAPIDGLIVEKNFNEGSMVDPDDDIFQIADLSQLLVLANVYEEDLPALRKLEPGHRSWLVDLKSDPHDKQREGTFDLIGTIIDPDSHTGVVMGWLDNSEENLAAGQFITATVELPADPHLVTIPSSALIEQGDTSYVLVETNAERHEFTRRKIEVKRRGRHSIYVCRTAEGGDNGNGSGADSLKVGERVIVSGVLELSAELDAVLSRHAEQEPEKQ